MKIEIYVSNPILQHCGFYEALTDELEFREIAHLACELKEAKLRVETNATTETQ